jgi:hypothetical protein
MSLLVKEFMMPLREFKMTPCLLYPQTYMSSLLIKTYAGMLFVPLNNKVVIVFLLWYCLVLDRDMFGLISGNEVSLV